MNRPLLRSILGSLAAGLTVAAVVAGCGDHRGRSVFQDDGDEGLAANSPTIVAMAAGSMALQAAIAVMDPTNHDVIQARPNVSVSGTSTNGSLELDFGTTSSTGNEIAEVDLREELDATFTRSNNSGTVNVSFPSLIARTDHLGTVDVFGTMVYTCTFSGATCSGTVVLDLTTVSNFETSDVSGTLNYTVTNGVVRYTSGTLDTDSSVHGDWTSTVSNVELDTNQASFRFIDSGSIGLTRTSGSSLGVSLLFTSPNRGTLTISPGSTTRSFDL